MAGRIWLLAIILAVAPLCNCATTIQSNIPDSETVTGSDWSAKDLKDVSEFMVGSIEQSAKRPGSDLTRDKARWILAPDLKNDTDEHVNTRVIMEKIRTRLINAGVAKFVDDQALNDILNQLKLQQSGLYDTQTVAQVGKLVGAKKILRGTISSIRKRSERKDIIFYNITLQIVNIETGDILWTDEKEIQRLTTKSRFR
jgi:uncharacterized protein (TIGR02722 family)